MSIQGTEPAGAEMTRWQTMRSRLQGFCVRARRRLPYLVWHGQEVDVRVTFATEALTAESIDGAQRQFRGGDVTRAQNILHDLGISFDSGLGPDGRDWEWDWSLKGPISVEFRRPAKRPELRASRKTMNAAAAALTNLRADHATRKAQP